MADSTNGRSSFWTQADALLRKNLIFQASRVELLDEVQVRAIQDIKGKEWTFQFRFWPNNNSRMYVLEGVTPCIQNMQLQADDTVTFSRIDPGGQPVIGCCKATNNVDVQGQKSKEWITLGYSSSLPYVDCWIGVFLPANFRTSS